MFYTLYTFYTVNPNTTKNKSHHYHPCKSV
jgi:hypothetical protein